MVLQCSCCRQKSGQMHSLAIAPLRLSLQPLIDEWFHLESQWTSYTWDMDIWNDPWRGFDYGTILWGCRQGTCFPEGLSWAWCVWVSSFTAIAEHLLLLAALASQFGRCQLKASRHTYSISPWIVRPWCCLAEVWSRSRWRGICVCGEGSSRRWHSCEMICETSWTWDADNQKKKEGKGCSALYFGHMHSCGIFPHRANVIDAQQPTWRRALKAIGHDAEKNGNTSISANLVNAMKLKHIAGRAKKQGRRILWETRLQLLMWLIYIYMYFRPTRCLQSSDWGSNSPGIITSAPQEVKCAHSVNSTDEGPRREGPKQISRSKLFLNSFQPVTCTFR